MVVLEICSMDCRGLASDKIKRRYIFLMCRQSYDISLLIDAHCNSMCIAILFKNAFQFEMLKSRVVTFTLLVSKYMIIC
jgi:hypothetical protein